MNGVLADGVAHLSFRGGGIFLPARNPYDRQILSEHAVQRARAHGRVQVLVDDERWTICLKLDPSVLRCGSCDSPLELVCLGSRTPNTPRCVRCALMDGPKAAPRSAEHTRTLARRQPMRARAGSTFNPMALLARSRG